MPVKQPEPEDDESYEDFMDRCVAETDDEEACDMAWQDRAAPAVMHKTHAGQIDGSEYILSDETPDRMGDIIEAKGWRLDNFKRNPVALFAHRSDFPIGTWKNLRIEKGALRAHLELAPAGTSDRIDEIRRLIDAGVLKATSVGFRPIKHAPINEESPWEGTRFLEQECVECSIVSVPANPNALAVAKSLDISRDTLALVFSPGKANGNGHVVTRGLTGGQAEIPPIAKAKAMSISQNVVERQGQLNLLKEGLEQHLASLDNDNVSDDQMKRTDDFHGRIAKQQRLLEQAMESEKLLGKATAEMAAHEVRMPARYVSHAEDNPKPNGNGIHVYPEIKVPEKPGDNLFRALTCLVRMQGDKYRRAQPFEVIRETYGENDKVRTAFDNFVGKAATLPALTTTTGWAAELVRTQYADWMELLQPASVAGRLLARGLQFNFGNSGTISIPTRAATPTIAGSFVLEGAAIPVRQGAFTAIPLVQKKMACITVFSREISEHSVPAIEGLLRSAIVEDTATAIDSVLMDANVATATRPAGLRSASATLTPTAGGGFAGIVGDVKLAVGALLTSTLGNLRAPVWLMSPALELALKLLVAPNTGTFIFADQLNNGSFAGFPVIVSPNVTADTLFLIDTADLVSASGPPRFDVSDSATVHMDDAPTAIGTTGTPNVVAAPVRSFWQTDCLGIRMIMPLNWAMRRTGMVTYITGTTWD